MDVKVTVSVGARTVAVEDVGDPRVRTGLLAAAKQVASKLARIRCPAHKKAPSNVRIHFDRNGAANLKYDSCCAALGDRVGQALG